MKIPGFKIQSYLGQHNVSDYNPSKIHHDQLVRGAFITNVNIGSVEGTAKRCEAVRKFVGPHERKYGYDPLVFIAAKLLWDCHNDNGLTYREFTTACAVNSIIGFKQFPVLVRRQMIIARQLGYKTPAVMQAELNSNPTRKPLTVQQLRDTLDRLENRDLLRRCQASPRCVFFSTTLNHEQLRDGVQKLIKNRAKPSLNRETDRKLFKFGIEKGGTT